MTQNRQINWEDVGNFANALLSTAGNTFSQVGSTVAQFQNNQNARQNNGQVNSNYTTPLSINPALLIGGAVALVGIILLLVKSN